MSSTKPTPNARRRDHQTHQDILSATTALLEESGYKRLSIEAIAVRAGVGKQTIYRWWKGKAALVIEAFMSATADRAADAAPDTGHMAEDLRLLLASVFHQNEFYDRGTALATKSMMAEAQLDREFLVTFRTLVQSWHILFLEVLERGKARGELDPDADSAALVDLLMGATWYRVLLEHAPLDDAYADAIIRTVTEGNRPGTL